jgi:restriction system protein
MLLALFQFLSIFWPVWIILGIWLVIKLSIKFYQTHRLSKSGITELDNLNGLYFEKYLEILFKKLGYQVKRTRHRGDYGADFVIQKERIQTVVQAKRYKRAVGIKAIQEAVAAKEYYKCSRAMVVTNSYYSPQARKLARANQVELWDRRDLVSKLLFVKQKPAGEEVLIPSSSAQAPAHHLPTSKPSPAESCHTCGKPVSPQVSRYCLKHQDLFGGKIYCYDHQKVIRSKATGKSVRSDG